MKTRNRISKSSLPAVPAARVARVRPRSPHMTVGIHGANTTGAFIMGPNPIYGLLKLFGIAPQFPEPCWVCHACKGILQASVDTGKQMHCPQCRGAHAMVRPQTEIHRS